MMVLMRSFHAPPPLTPPLKGEGDSGVHRISPRSKASEFPIAAAKRWSPSPLRGGVRGGGIPLGATQDIDPQLPFHFAGKQQWWRSV
jgi:hypothetical protein